MSDYSSVGLNSDGLPVDAPLAQDRGFISAFQQDSNYSVPLGRINYSNLTASSRTYTAIVSLSREQGTFTDLQAAINYVNGLGGGIVFIKKGTYTLPNNLTMFSNINLVGEDNTNTIIDFNSTSNQILGSMTNNISLTNLQFINCTATKGAIYVADLIGCNITRCRFQNNTVDIYSDAINNRAELLRVRDCVGTNSGNFATVISTRGNCSFENNYIVNPSNHVFIGDGLAAGNWIGNLALTAAKGYFQGTFGNAKIAWNSHTNAGTSTDYLINIQNGAGEIIGNRLSPGNAGGIKITSSGIQTKITDNQLSLGTGGHGIWSQSSQCSIIGNVISLGGTFSGIFLDGASNCAIMGNFSSTGSAGILLDNTSNFNKIIGNDVTGTAYGIRVNNANCGTNIITSNRASLSGTATSVSDGGTGDVLANNA